MSTGEDGWEAEGAGAVAISMISGADTATAAALMPVVMTASTTKLRSSWHSCLQTPVHGVYAEVVWGFKPH